MVVTTNPVTVAKELSEKCNVSYDRPTRTEKDWTFFNAYKMGPA